MIISFFKGFFEGFNETIKNENKNKPIIYPPIQSNIKESVEEIKNTVNNKIIDNTKPTNDINNIMLNISTYSYIYVFLDYLKYKKKLYRPRIVYTNKKLSINDILSDKTIIGNYNVYLNDENNLTKEFKILKHLNVSFYQHKNDIFISHNDIKLTNNYPNYF